MFNELQTLLSDILVNFQPEFEIGISEYELICILKSPPYSVFDKDALNNPLMYILNIIEGYKHYFYPNFELVLEKLYLALYIHLCKVK